MYGVLYEPASIWYLIRDLLRKLLWSFVYWKTMMLCDEDAIDISSTSCSMHYTFKNSDFLLMFTFAIRYGTVAFRIYKWLRLCWWIFECFPRTPSYPIVFRKCWKSLKSKRHAYLCQIRKINVYYLQKLPFRYIIYTIITHVDIMCT